MSQAGSGNHTTAHAMSPRKKIEEARQIPYAILGSGEVKAITSIQGHWDGCSADPPRVVRDYDIKARELVNGLQTFCIEREGFNASGGFLYDKVHYQCMGPIIGPTINGLRVGSPMFGDQYIFRWFLVEFAGARETSPYRDTNWVRYDLLNNVQELMEDYYLKRERDYTNELDQNSTPLEEKKRKRGKVNKKSKVK